MTTNIWFFLFCCFNSWHALQRALTKQTKKNRVFQNGCTRFQNRRSSCTANLVLLWRKSQPTQLVIDGNVGKHTIIRKCVFLKRFLGNTFDKCLPAAEAAFRAGQISSMKSLIAVGREFLQVRSGERNPELHLQPSSEITLRRIITALLVFAGPRRNVYSGLQFDSLWLP